MGVKRPQLFTAAYRFAKFNHAAEEFLACIFGSRQASASASGGGTSEQQRNASLPHTLQSAFRKAQEAYEQPLTKQIYLTGAAMAPTLNKAAQDDRTAVEKLVVRLLKRPGAGNVLVGDVVAFYSPLAQADAQHVMVRRVAAVEGMEMVSSGQEDSFTIPDGHCWVLADNDTLKPSEVIDSRSFGHIHFNSILGRVIYAARSRRDHGPVPNNPESVVADAPVVEAEVDVDAMFPEQPSGR